MDTTKYIWGLLFDLIVKKNASSAPLEALDQYNVD